MDAEMNVAAVATLAEPRRRRAVISWNPLVVWKRVIV
jgi:hypothetical protein